MRALPATVHEISGNHRVAIDRTKDITKYVAEAVELLRKAYEKDIGPHHRGGLLREGDAMLETIIRFANCAREELRIAYCAHPAGEPE